MSLNLSSYTDLPALILYWTHYVFDNFTWKHKSEILGGVGDGDTWLAMDEDDVGEPTGLGAAPCVLFVINYSSIEYYCTLIVYNLSCSLQYYISKCTCTI